MPYFKVPVNVLLSAIRYVEAEDANEAAEKVEMCDNSVPYISNWPDSDDYYVDEKQEVEEVSEEEYEQHQDNL